MGSGGAVEAGAAGDTEAVGVLVGVTGSVHAVATSAMAIQVRASAISFIRSFSGLVVLMGAASIAEQSTKNENALTPERHPFFPGCIQT